jgi:Pyruvate/2-oxoacid:ferredoxin oxidoreductase gamma subunit
LPSRPSGTGAPVTAFCRIDDRPIRSREPIVEPDAPLLGGFAALTGVVSVDSVAAAIRRRFKGSRASLRAATWCPPSAP